MTHALRVQGTETQAAKKPAASSTHALEDLVKRAIGILEDYKALDVAVLPLAGKADFADFMVIATGTSTRHVASIGQALREGLKHDLLGLEGLREGEWVCADTGSVVVHVFLAEKRALYNLEKLWSYAFTPAE